MYSPSLGKYAEFYQELLKGFVSYEHLGNRLIQLAEQAQALRQYHKVKEISLILSNIPITSYQAIGHYFLAVAANSKGNGDQEKARRLFELTMDMAPDAYKVKAMLSLGAVSFHKKDFDSAFYFFRETIKAGSLSVASVQAIRGISILKGIEGHHKHALKDLEALLPVIKHVPPHIYFDLLNSYAVELGEAGRKDEARNISKLVLASPFAYAYPEWQQTAEDLKGASRSFVVVDQSPYVPPNVLPMPAFERDNAEPPSWAGQPAQVVNYEQWIKKMGKGKKSNGGKKVDDMTVQELMMQIVHIYTSPTTTDIQRRKIFAAIERIMAEPDKPEPSPDEPKPDEPDGA